MNSIIDIPLLFWRVTEVNWRIDWRGQGALSGLNGADQAILNRFPRFVGAAPLVLPPQMIPAWRALMTKGAGRANVYRVRMLDPVAQAVPRQGWRADWADYQRGFYSEARPQVICAAGAAAGATSITVDERALPAPIKVGAYLSHNDWPFAVTGRSGTGAATVLEVAQLRRTIPAGGPIDCIARGLFRATDDATGQVGYGLDRVARPTLDLVEWITRP
ncbi:hypothetical protein CKO11_12335 [Rhodobacter sp. TJ_12]|uniref:hypothetical protein n=1 Tax=Rhodobacter sp. TJ_12 TaxID=2029399 RepID=UPI001CBF6CA4|nr:hypothetical protein [Rhodobacter sp. TJ_12]MBZ4023246.1 hypothetical protein [Rhodobacter sp. TJ_12]